jgi:hypothetical protein
VKAETKAEIRAALATAKLPAISQDRILAQFEGAASMDGVEDAINREVDYIKALTEQVAPARRGGPVGQPRVSNIVVGLGATGTREATTEEAEMVTPSAESFAEHFGGIIPGGPAVAKRVYEQFAV